MGIEQTVQPEGIRQEAYTMIAAMYDVLYMAYRDGAAHRSVVGSGLDRDAACELARSEARKRNAGRMFLAGSEPGPVGDVVLIVESETAAA